MGTLNLMEARIDPVELVKWSSKKRIEDLDRALHCVIYEKFGSDRVPKPFLAQLERGRLIAYTPYDAAELMSSPLKSQSQELAVILPSESVKISPTPEQWHLGTKFSFSVRVRPIKRVAWVGKNRKTERDIFIGYDGDLTRAELYCQWVAEQMVAQGGAVPIVETLAMTKFQTRRVRRQKRSDFSIGPDVTVTGALTVSDSGKFKELLTRGIGRHRAYGYGMLLLTRVM